MDSSIVPTFDPSAVTNYLIGKGAFSQIFLLEETNAVIKVTSFDKESKEGQRVELDALMEVEILKTIPPHEHMVCYISHEHKSNMILTRLEKVEGSTLTTWYLEKKIKNLDCNMRKNIIIQLCDVLVHVHKHGYIHRDVSNNNIMCKENGNITLIDFCFGLSTDMSKRSLKPTTALGAISSRRCQGTVGYCAPENSQRPNLITESVDAYSWVCIILDLVAGNPAEQICGYHDILCEEPLDFPVDEEVFNKVSFFSSDGMHVNIGFYQLASDDILINVT
jgi:serine/threonine protein kinase